MNRKAPKSRSREHFTSWIMTNRWVTANSNFLLNRPAGEIKEIFDHARTGSDSMVKLTLLVWPGWVEGEDH